MKKYSIWLKVAAVFQIITAGIHSIALFASPLPKNETEKQLLKLIETYQIDLGNGFHRTTKEVTLALSACFTLLCLFGGLLNWYLIKKKLGVDIMKGIVLINLIVFGICFALMAALTFLPPITLTGLIFIFLLLSWLATLKRSAN